MSNVNASTIYAKALKTAEFISYGGYELRNDLLMRYIVEFVDAYAAQGFCKSVRSFSLDATQGRRPTIVIHGTFVDPITKMVAIDLLDATDRLINEDRSTRMAAGAVLNWMNWGNGGYVAVRAAVD